MFEEQSKSDWEAKVEKDLKGKPLASLEWSVDQMTIGALYHADDQAVSGTVVPQRKNNQWKIGEWIAVRDAKTANQQGLAALQKGANALCFELSHAPNRSEFSILLEGIHLEWMTLHFWGSSGTQVVVEQLLKEYIALRNYDPALVSAYFTSSEQGSNLPPLISVFKRYGIQLDHHASPATSLAKALQQTNDRFLSWLENDWSLVGHARAIHFWWVPSDHYLVNIAQIRAFRLLWEQFLKAWELPDRPLQLSALVKDYGEDANHNKIKATAQATSAVIGGVDQLFIAPADHLSEPNGTIFSRRIALNIQHLLEQESYLHRVADPAAGSYFFESLTNELAAEAWQQFQQLTTT